MELTLKDKYLNLPVTNGAEMRRVKLIIDGRTVREFEIELAEGPPDFWVFMDVTAFNGRAATLEVDPPECAAALAAVTQSDTITGAEDLYAEKYRPQFHFSSRRGWNNDPNGLVFYDGEYHLFYQHNPYGRRWGNMHWGHAVSRDLVHWRELPIALYPREFGDWRFSGSAAVDADNTGGFKTGDEDVIVAAHTSTGRGECISYSNDRGWTFTEYEGNPVVEHVGRDPKIIRHGPTGQWVMAVYDEISEKNEKGGIAFYTSPDLKHWRRQSRIDGYFECPELFEMPVDGRADDMRWVVYAGDGDYAIGQFDGKTFTLAHEGKTKFSYGNCFYASQTFSDVPPDDGRRIQIGWGQADPVGMPFSQMMLFPCELTLRTVNGKLVMFAYPVAEIDKLHGKPHAWRGLAVGEGDNPLSDISGDLFDIRAEIAPGDARKVAINVRGVAIECDLRQRTLSCLDKTAPLPLTDGVIRLRVLVDRTTIEIFAADGQVYMPMSVLPADEDRSLALSVSGGTATANNLEVFELQSAWK